MSSLNLGNKFGAIAEGLIDAGAEHLKLKLVTGPPPASEFAKGGEAAARDLAEKLRGDVVRGRSMESVVGDWIRAHGVDFPRF